MPKNHTTTSCYYELCSGLLVGAAMIYTYEYSIPIIHLIIFQPHLHTIVNRSMELAMSAKEPYNYFLLLRALFRSIGGGSLDLYISLFYTFNSPYNISAPPPYYSEPFHGAGHECQGTIQLFPATTSSIQVHWWG